MAVDEDLLERSNAENDDEEVADESETAGDLRAARRGSATSPEEKSLSLREAKQQETSNKKNVKAQEKPATIKPSISPLRAATDKMLMFAWESLIPSFGLTLIWIDIHVFLNKALGPSAFCELGEEWIPPSMRQKMAASKDVQESMALVKKTEEIGCGCLNLGCLFTILFLLVLIALVGAALANPLQALWDLTRSSLSSFFDLF